jgi:HlyD family secretion protein
MSMRRRMALAVAAVVIIVLLAVALMPSPIPVSVTPVERGYFAEYVEEEGRTRLRDPHTISVPMSGYLHRVELDPGDPVDLQTVLFELEAMPAPALDARAREQAREAVAAAGARLEASQAELEARTTQRTLAETEYQRAERLRRDNLISAEERDRRLALRDAARTAERAALHATEVARFELESARAVLQVADGERARGDQPRLELRSPIAGTVTRRFRCCEGPVQAGEPILEIGDLARLEVQVDLLSMEAVRVRPGMRVILERWGGGDALDGVVRRIEPAGFQRISALGVEEQRVPVLVDIRSPRETWQELGDGYRVEARFVLWEGDDVVQVPTSALFRSDDRWVLFVAADGRAALRYVVPGRRSGLVTQIVDGVASGALVITHPSDRIVDGSRVDHRID